VLANDGGDLGGVDAVQVQVLVRDRAAIACRSASWRSSWWTRACSSGVLAVTVAASCGSVSLRDAS
jgi:hypothetical protein